MMTRLTSLLSWQIALTVLTVVVTHGFEPQPVVIHGLLSVVEHQEQMIQTEFKYQHELEKQRFRLFREAPFESTFRQVKR